MEIERFINSRLQSNSYILYSDGGSDAWVIDPGDVEPIIKFLSDHHILLKGIFVTHYHFDHIYGINEFRHIFGMIPVYASAKAEDGFSSAKLNGSYYAEIPFTIDATCLIPVKQGDCIKLWENVFCVIYETPGHNDDCISFKIMDNLFTGDALIPGVKIHIKSKKANKDQALESIERIILNFPQETVINPGHKNSCKLKDINFNE